MALNPAIISADYVIDTLLADIPLYSVGLVGFGALTFFIAVRRLDKCSLFLFSSSVLAFVAAVLDLGRLMNQTKGQPCTSLMIAREALLSAAIASRYYFFWLLVALAPRGEVQRRYSWNQTLPTPANSKTHSGAWERWGIAGLILKHVLLLGVAASGTMHVIWRLGFVLNLDFFKPVHSAVTIVEMVLMVFFLVKLTLNVWISPMLPRWNTLRDYSPLLLAGLINLVVSIAELHSLGFTETPLGRFLVAIEHYILILYVLIYAFYRNPNKATNDPTATIPAPADNTEFPTATCIRPSNISSPVTRPSTVHRVSSWISRRVSGRPDSDQLRRWNAPQDIEAVSASPATLTALVEKISLDDFKGADPTFPYALRRDRRSFEEEEIEQADRSSPNLVRISYATTQADNTENMDSPPMDHLMPVPSAYASPQQGQSLMLPRARESALSSESPIYGLAGIITNPSSRSTTPGPLLTQSPPRPQPQRASTGTTIFPSDSSPGSASRLSSLRRAPTYPLRSAHRVAVTTSSSYSTRSPTSEYCPASPYAASEFSLSHFPIPPTPASAPLTAMTVARRSSMTLLPPVMKEKVGATTFPNTVHGLGESFGSSAELVYGGGAGDGSNGLRLDVTSFIGGLTRPDTFSPTTPGVGVTPSGMEMSPSDAMIIDIRRFGPTTLAAMIPSTLALSSISMDANRSLNARLKPIVSLPSNPRPKQKQQPTPELSPASALSFVSRAPTSAAAPLTPTTAKFVISQPQPQLITPQRETAFERPRRAPTVMGGQVKEGVEPNVI